MANNSLYSQVQYTCTCYVDNDPLQGQIADFPLQKLCDAFFRVSDISVSLNKRLPDAEKFLAQIYNSFDSIIIVKCRLLSLTV